MSQSLSHSALQKLQACPRKYKLSYIDGWEKAGESRGQRRGKAFSDALEHRDASKIAEAYDQYIMDAVTQVMVDDLVIEQAIVTELFLAHSARFQDDQREIAFDEPIPGWEEFRNRGFVDGAHLGAGGVIDELADDKLIMMWGRADEAALPLNGQVLRYLNQFPSADRLVYRVTKYPSLIQRKGRGKESVGAESPSEFAERCVDAVRQKAAKDELFVVIPLERVDLEAQLKEYDDDLKLRAAEVTWRTGTNNWPGAYGEACKAYGGCEFLAACKRVPNYEEFYTQKEQS